MWQYIILAVVIASAISYVFYNVWKSFQVAGNPCRGCSGCSIRNQIKAKQQAQSCKCGDCSK